MTRTVGKPAMNFGAPPVAPADGNPAAEALAALGGARGMTQTRTQYTTAVVVQVPRDLEAIRKAVIREAGYSRDSFFYAWTQKDKNSSTGQGLIEGVSIDGAMILIRNWGNAVCEPDLVDETPSHWMLKATFIDLETGFTSGRLFRQRKNQKTGKHDDERALDIALQIGQSKAIRNAVVRCVPQWLVDEAMDAAKAAAANRFADVAKHAKTAIDSFFAHHKVTLDQLERKLGKKRPDWIPTDLVILSAIFRALKEGLTSVGQEFSTDEPVETAAAETETSKTETVETGWGATGSPPSDASGGSSATPSADAEPPDGDAGPADDVQPGVVATGADQAAIDKAMASIKADAEKAATAAETPKPKEPPPPAKPPEPDFQPPTKKK